MAYKLISVKVEGRSTSDFTALNRTEKTLIEVDNYDDAMFEFNYENNRHRKAGGEVVMSGSDRSFFINSSNEPYEMLDVVEG